jgi:hypothetical protein
MKKLILSAMLVAFAVAVNAADEKACADKAATGCCAKAVTEAKSDCTMAKGDCPMAKQQVKATCPYAKDGKETASKPLASPKGSEQAKK